MEISNNLLNVVFCDIIHITSSFNDKVTDLTRL